MRILSIRPEVGRTTLARFDLEVTEHMRIMNMILRVVRDGQLRISAPKSGGTHCVTFHPTLAETIKRAAAAALEGRAAYAGR